MAGLWLKTVTLVFFLFAGSLAAVDQNKLAQLIQAVKTQYPIQGMFSFALSIQGMDQNQLDQIFEDNPQDVVTQMVSKREVYTGKRLNVAKLKGHEHAEWRVLKDLNLESNTGDLLVIYCQSSSCPRTCTEINGPYNIMDKIDIVIEKGKWSEKVFVFENVFQPKTEDIDVDELKQALVNLATSKIKLANIFRCYTPQNHDFQCTSCSSGGEVANVCYDYNLRGRSRSRSRSRGGSKSRSRSRSRSRGGSKSRSRSRSRSRGGSKSRSRSRSRSRGGSKSRSRSRSRSRVGAGVGAGVQAGG
ncbi:uncharacterized protein LOC129096270 [Anoplopoma fimbria]|uniref:uncharacterized protein LOC129096270 n=1 Tax=Anoplopoma fimbria TaxID=229290 RepID=UPI0023EDF621|nr:uncharacterized protein LOC129096270 [Anoplopoma fimbria]